MSVDPDQIVAIAPDENIPPGKLPFWIVHALNGAGITTYLQLSNYSPETIMLIPSMTRAAVECIKAELGRRNLNLGPLVVIPAQKTPPEAMAAERNVGLTSNWGTSDPTAPAPNGGWHAGLTAQVPPISATAPLIAPHHAPEQAFLRDQLAMAALAGLIASTTKHHHPRSVASLATQTYEIADAMLKERGRGKEGAE